MSTNPRTMRSLRACHLPAEPKPYRTPPPDTGAYVPELAARLDNDPNLTDGARRCMRKIAEYAYIRHRETRRAEITVTWLVKALRRSRRTVQRYLRELERAGYIAARVLASSRTGLCVGLLIELLRPLFPNHHAAHWPARAPRTSTNSGATFLSLNYRFRYKNATIPVQVWALRCMDGIFNRLMSHIGPFQPAV
jgi:hypothetical protein